MRDIKFRAWHKIRKEIYIVHGWHSEFVFKDTLDGLGNDGNPDKLCDVELMQYTGFTDKNGTEIYEGDTVHLCGSNFNYKVVFENGSFILYHLVSLDGARWGELSKFYEVKMTAYQLEVTGNIYDV